MSVSYTKDMRQIAAERSEYLITFDVVRPDGSRELLSQGPMRKDEAKIMADAWGKAIQLRAKRAAAAKEGGRET